MDPAKLALVAQFSAADLVPYMIKDAADAAGVVTLHSATKYLVREMLVKHAEYMSTLVGLEVLKELSNAR